jgi:hypothetical protein
MSASGGKAAVHPWLVRRIKQVANRMSALIESGHSNAWKLQVLTGSFRPEADVQHEQLAELFNLLLQTC